MLNKKDNQLDSCPYCGHAIDTFKNIYIDDQSICIDGTRVNLSGQELSFLRALINSHPRCVPYSRMENILWGDKVDGGPEWMRNHVKVLKWKVQKKLNGLADIETVWGVGYTLKISQNGDIAPERSH